jgi:hypothetical protein
MSKQNLQRFALEDTSVVLSQPALAENAFTG